MSGRNLCAASDCGYDYKSASCVRCGIGTPYPIARLTAGEKVPPGVPLADSKPTNPKDLIGSGKLPLHLFPASAISAGCLAFLEGALKYGRANWRAAGVRASIYKDALDRHMVRWFEGENIDPDSGIPHLAKALACIAILIDAEAAGKLEDDRMIQGGTIDLIETLTPTIKVLKERYGHINPKHFTIKDNSK